jgi:2-polyprenyl-3-methyl-5-hydroxy-6-metoxy-1,4-benzoquinol methylase
MIIHKLIAQHLKHRDDAFFYALQAQDAIRWLEQSGVAIGQPTRALDLGCGHGVFGCELQKRGCRTTFADESCSLLPEIANAQFLKVNLDQEDISRLGEFELVVCSNVLEHLAKPRLFIDSVHKLLTPGGHLYLSWTNWLSPWGGHEFSPFHYLGARHGHQVYDRLFKRKRLHTPFENLFPTYIGSTLEMIEKNPNLGIVRKSPRYYPELGFLLSLPGLREFLAWNCAILITRK